LTFRDIKKGKGKEMKDSICIGLRRGKTNKDEHPIVIAPDDNERVKEDDSILVLADTMSGRRHGELSSNSQRNLASTRLAVAPPGKCKICIVNWNDNTVDLIECLDQYMHEGSEVHVLSTLPEEDRKARLSQHHLKNITVVHQVGPEGQIESIRALPLAQAHCILVCGQSGARIDDPANWNDARVLACSITIHEHLKKENLTTRLICECYSSRTKRMLDKEGSPLRDVATFFHSNSLETGLVAMAGASRAVYNTLVTLMDGEIANIVAMPWSDLNVKDSRTADQRSPLVEGRMTFKKIQENLKKGQILLGYYAAGTKELILNPENRGEEIKKGDELIILQRGQ